MGNIFDILGPVMVGPSSSHTAGAVRIGMVARQLFGRQPERAEVYLHGSFAATGKGHGTDRALIAGLFRAGGDTKFGLICDTIDMWCYAIPLGFFAAFVLKLPVLWVYFLLCTDEYVKWPCVIKHYREGKWAKNITREEV